MTVSKEARLRIAAKKVLKNIRALNHEGLIGSALCSSGHDVELDLSALRELAKAIKESEAK